jgi:hypothetical protein
VKPNYYAILEECLELGVPLGYRRAHKHSENQTEEEIFLAIEEAVMSEICQRFIFESPGE